MAAPPAADPRLLVLAEARRRRRAGLSQPLRRPHLKELLRVHGLEDVEGRREKLLRLTLIRHSRLTISGYSVALQLSGKPDSCMFLPLFTSLLQALFSKASVYKYITNTFRYSRFFQSWKVVITCNYNV